MKRLPLVLILTIALALRLVNAFLIPWQGGDMVVSDMQGYDRAAVALLEQQPLSVHTAERYLFHPLGSDTYHPPAYYYFLAGVYAIAGHSYLAVRIVQAVLDTLTCFIIYCIGKGVFGYRAGRLAAAVAAVYPPLIFYTGVLLTETLSTCLLAGATWLLLDSGQFAVGSSQLAVSSNKALSTPSHKLMLGGLLLGLAGLTRSVLLLIEPVALLWLWFIAAKSFRGSQQTLKASLIRYSLALLLPVGLVIAPITLRNYQIHHRFVLISTNGGVNFFLGHGGSERLKNQVRNIPPTYSAGQLIGISSRTEPEEEAYFYRLGWNYVREHPWRVLRSLPGKFVQMYWDSDYWPATDAQASILRAIDLVLWKLLLLPLSLLGWLMWHAETRRRAALLYLVLLCSSCIPLLFWAQTRFRMPFVPYFIVLAAGAATEALGRLTSHGRTDRDRAVIGGIAS
jgi:4-amino-4-deoxy-L-arabinose transferase-like glycosyltransferase